MREMGIATIERIRNGRPASHLAARGRALRFTTLQGAHLYAHTVAVTHVVWKAEDLHTPHLHPGCADRMSLTLSLVPLMGLTRSISHEHLTWRRMWLRVRARV